MNRNPETNQTVRPTEPMPNDDTAKKGESTPKGKISPLTPGALGKGFRFKPGTIEKAMKEIRESEKLPYSMYWPVD